MQNQENNLFHLKTINNNISKDEGYLVSHSAFKHQSENILITNPH